MSERPVTNYTPSHPQEMNEEVAALVKQIRKEATRNLLIFAGVKIAVFVALHQLKKRVATNA